MIRVLIADDHAIVRDGLKRLVEETPGLALAGETARGRVALERAQEPDVDVVLLDLSLEDMGGIEVLRRLQESRPELPVIVLSMYAEEQYAPRLLRMGARAYLSKGRSSAELIEAIRKVAAGERYLTPVVAELLAAGDRDQAPVERLSPRELQIFLLVAKGRAPGEIAAELDVTASTVSSHLIHIREKLGARTNGELVQYAYRTGLVDEKS